MRLRWRYLAELTKKLGISQVELSRRVGISEEYVSKLFNGSAGDMKVSTAAALARELGLPIDAIFESEELASNVSAVNEAAPLYGTEQPPRMVPVVGLVGAADSSLNLSYEDGGYPPGFGPYGAVDVPMRDPSAFALKVEGDSMEPGVPTGSTVVVADRPLVDGALSVVQALDGRAWLKRVRRVNGSYLLESFNATAYPSFLLKLEEVRQVWRVIWIKYP